MPFLRRRDNGVIEAETALETAKQCLNALRERDVIVFMAAEQLRRLREQKYFVQSMDMIVHLLEERNHKNGSSTTWPGL